MISVYKKLISYANEKKHYLVFTVFFSIVAAIMQVLAFYYIFKLLENVVGLNNASESKKIALLISGLFACGGILYFLSVALSHLFAFRLETNLRKYGIEGLTSASFKFFDINSSGKTRKLIDDNAAQTHMAVAHLIPDNIGAIITPFLLLIVGLLISFRVGMALILLILAIIPLMKLMMGEPSFMVRYQASLERLSAETVEYVRGMQVIKIFGVDVTRFKALNEAITDYAKNALGYSLSCKKPYVLFQSIFFGIIFIVIPIVLLFIDIKSNPALISVELIMILFLSGVMYTYIMKVMYLSMYVFQASDAVGK